ncbi:HipA N-terminal domain-containing protein [Stakelama tenebrarum]|uniref:HipA N-terminal domain-containing protein n=1 Tax=Stakelama tenebrarum TaxID=2711215 RepID=UPI003899E107
MSKRCSPYSPSSSSNSNCGSAANPPRHWTTSSDGPQVFDTARCPERPPGRASLQGRQRGGRVSLRSGLARRGTYTAGFALTPTQHHTYSGAAVTAVFDNLPSDNDDIRRRIAARFGTKGTDFCSLLAAIGRDCVGALQLLPEDEAPHLPARSKPSP